MAEKRTNYDTHTRSLVHNLSMATSNSVNTDWKRSAGDFQCLECRKKRLPANRFSKTQVKAALKHEQKGAICLECMKKREEAENAEKELGKNATDGGDGDDEVERLVCSICNEKVLITKFSKSQSNHIKHGRPGKCKPCIEKMEEAELTKISDKKKDLQNGMKKKFSNSRGKKKVAGALAMACMEAALEGEQITGIKAERSDRGGKRSWRDRHGGGRGGRGPRRGGLRK